MPLSWEQRRTTSLRWVVVVNLATMNFPLQASAILALLTTATVASTAAATPNACFLRYLLASKACPNCRLGSLELSHLDLAEANFQGADLIEANLERAILTGADLSGAYLVGANLPQANLRGANLSGSYLEGTDLRGADLRGANLSTARTCAGPICVMPTGLELTCALPAPKAHAFRVLSGSSAKSSL
jgi:uncharacterized protein YjbI with pentapeptide repeats